MFSELFESVARPSSKGKRWALAMSVAIQTICLVILVLVPLICIEALPKAMLNTVLVTLPGAASKPATQAPTVRSGAHSVRLLHNGVLIEPPRIPPTVNRVIESPFAPETPMTEGPLTASFGLDLLSVAPAPAERVSRPAVSSAPQRVLLPSTIEEARLILQIRPVYPPLAIQARIQGEVVLHAIIGKDGGVSELQPLSGHPLLVNAAREAVRQWRYRPTLLNGQAVEVETTITVSFVLEK